MYDGDGNRVKATVGGVTTAYIGTHYEWLGGGVARKYYFAGATRIGMRDNGTMYYLFGDHLGSTAVTANYNGTTWVEYGEVRYKPWGENRYNTGTTPTTWRFTGQRREGELGLYFYNARWYDPSISRFVSADTIVPELGNPQAWNRYSYAYNNPLKYTDPSGYDPFDEQAFWDWLWWRHPEEGYEPTDADRQDWLFSLVLAGSDNGAWTDQDWDHYYANRKALWEGTLRWKNDELGPGLERFRQHVDRLASFYSDDEEDQFLRAMGLLFAGIPYDTDRIFAGLGTIGGPGGRTFLYEGIQGWYPAYADDENPLRDQAHHFVGYFLAGYYLNYKGIALALVDLGNAGDVALGIKASVEAIRFRQGSFSPGQFAATYLADLGPSRHRHR